MLLSRWNRLLKNVLMAKKDFYALLGGLVKIVVMIDRPWSSLVEGGMTLPLRFPIQQKLGRDFDSVRFFH